MTDSEKLINNFADLAAQYWVLLRSYERTIKTASPQHYNKLKSVHRNAEFKLSSIIQECGIRIVSYEGNKYSPNLAATILNGDEFSENENLIVSQVIEPTIMFEEKILKIGKVVLSVKE